MNTPRPVGNYAELCSVLRERISESGAVLSRLDEPVGTSTRFLSKCLSPHPVKFLGIRTLFDVLTTLGLQLTIQEDPDQLAKMQSRSDWPKTLLPTPRPLK